MASITCRSGEKFPNTHTHTSVADVRKCQGAVSGWKTESPRPDTSDPRNVYLNPRGVNAQLAAFEAEQQHRTRSIPERPTEPTKFSRELGVFGGKVDAAPGTLTGPSRVDPELEAKVPAGRYAVKGEDGVLKFYRVEKPTEGAWAGRTFVKVRAGDDWHRVRYAQARAGVLCKIAADVRAASIRYGLELGQCGVCGRTLTNPESIKRGIGPVCEARL